MITTTTVIVDYSIYLSQKILIHKFSSKYVLQEKEINKSTWHLYQSPEFESVNEAKGIQIEIETAALAFGYIMSEQLLNVLKAFKSVEVLFLRFICNV